MRLTVKRFRMVGNRVCRQACDPHVIYFCTILEAQGRWSATTGGPGSRIRNGRGTRRAPEKTWRWRTLSSLSTFVGCWGGRGRGLGEPMWPQGSWGQRALLSPDSDHSQGPPRTPASSLHEQWPLTVVGVVCIHSSPRL